MNNPIRPRLTSATVLLPPFLFAAAAFMGADFTAICLRPLRALRISYPAAMDHANWIIAGGCLLAWAATVRRRPRAAGIVTVIGCFWLIGLIPWYADRRVATVPVSRWLTPAERTAVESQVGGPIFENGSSDGPAVVVAPPDAATARAALARLGMARPAGQ